MKKVYMFFLLVCLWGCGFLTAADQPGTRYPSLTQAEREEYVSKNNHQLSREFCKYIRKGYIELGMTKEDVRASWGKPQAIRIKKMPDSDEVWVYVPNWKFRDQLYFDKGVLVRTSPDYLVVSGWKGMV